MIAAYPQVYKLTMQKSTHRIDLDKLLPHGMIATRKWLLEQGVGRYALDDQAKSGNFVSVAAGVYSRAGVMLAQGGHGKL